ncbi:MAG TPA: ERF family protein [Aquabacterium sp.]|nr:ERF family protein [Aquabacterium sp.]
MNGVVETAGETLPAQIQQERSPGMALLQVAASRGAPPEELEKWMALHERWEANEARKAYMEAMAAFKSVSLRIEKDRLVRIKHKIGDGVTEYRHASLAAVVDAAVARMGEFGLSHKWEPTQSDGGVSVKCVITHKLGHSESVTLAGPRDDSGSKNTLQQIASTITYLERYTLMAILGLAAKEMDDDARTSGAPPAFISVDQATALTDLAREHGVTQKRFFTYMKVDAMEKILASDYGKAEAAIKSMSAGKQK